MKLRSNLFHIRTMTPVVLLFLFVGLLAACAGESPSERAAEVGGVTAAQIIENPNAYVGRTVTVSGDVEEIHDPRAFNIDSGISLGELLVVGREPFPQVPDAGNRAFVINDTATITGTVRLLVAADIEREIGWDLQPQLEAEYNARPVLVAQQVSFRPGMNRGAANNAGAPSGTTNATNMEAMTGMAGAANTNAGANANYEDVDFLTVVGERDRTGLIGRRLRFSGVEVQSVIGDRTFYIGPSQTQRLLVVLDEQRTPNTPIEGRYDVNRGQRLTLNGTIERMPPLQEANQRFGRLVDQKELQAWQNQQVYLHIDSIANIVKPGGNN